MSTTADMLKRAFGGATVISVRVGDEIIISFSSGWKLKIKDEFVVTEPSGAAEVVDNEQLTQLRIFPHPPGRLQHQQL